MGNLLDERLDRLSRELIEMGALIEHAIESATQALTNQDVSAAAEAIAFDQEVDQKERDIEALCMKLLLKQQPVARDLRLISAALKMITDMERIGDQAADICEIMISGKDPLPLDKVAHLDNMALATVKMVNGAIDAFVERNVEFARAVMEEDDIVDELFDKVRDELLDLIRRDDAYGEQAIDLLMVAKYYERIGDHAQNIAEWVEYSITGIHKGEPLG